ncbi:hypothetical protein B0I37DRAFT_147669 [Chaetomium sp. MPI-CAGE-AT-0009]|nr:hypothetical protein B0I37DRAFT_147669 [Chaetomium sp. MPI-CAGE-AT-0009]
MASTANTLPDEATAPGDTTQPDGATLPDEASSPDERTLPQETTMPGDTTEHHEPTVAKETTQSGGATPAEESTLAEEAAQTSETFPYFQRFPPEIRAMIWELCLPRRLLPISTLVVAHNYRNAAAETDASAPVVTNPAVGALLNKTMARGCRIAQVCRESRGVALLGREPVEVLGLLWLGRGAWIDRRTDTLLLDCDVLKLHRDLWLELRAKLVAGPRAGPRRVRLALCGNMLNWYKPKPSPSEAEAEEEAAVGWGIRQKSWPVVMSHWFLVDREEEAKREGMFGFFAEERQALLDVSDDAREQQLTRLKKLGMPGLPEEADRQSLDYTLAQWRKDLDRHLLLGRELGFEGTDEEWRRDGAGPYPTIHVGRHEMI